jgi:two-component system, NarL family, nitrate/nitrite response regulator NarL
MRDAKLELVIRVLVADDTRLHTQLLADALRRDGGFEVIGSDAQELISRADLHNIEVLLLSSELDEQPARGFQVLREVRAVHPNVRAVVLLDSSKHELVIEAFRAGARGVLSKQESIETLSKCVRCVHQGQIWANSQQIGLLTQALISSQNFPAVNVQAMKQLSKRELEVVDCVSQGLSNREIAEHLGLSQHTVKNYLFKVFEKLEVSSRAELLFLTFSRNSLSAPGESDASQKFTGHATLSDSALAACRRAAEQGNPNAQLELAQYYWARRKDSMDLVQARKWYLIVSQQLMRTIKSEGKALTIEQVVEAEKMALEWLKKVQKPLESPKKPQLAAASARSIPDRKQATWARL